MEPSFEKLLVLLAERGIKFIVVGGIAVTLQGYIRFTEDVDMLIENSPENIDLLLGVLTGYGEGFAAELTRADFDAGEGAIRIVEETEQCQIDIFTHMTGRNYADVIVDADTWMLRGLSIRYASKASLIGWKENSVREKDKLDAMALRKLQSDPHSLD